MVGRLAEMCCMNGMRALDTFLFAVVMTTKCRHLSSAVSGKLLCVVLRSSQSWLRLRNRLCLLQNCELIAS